MIVPNYVPDTIEIPGNVNLEPYPVRLRFIQRVNALHVLSLGTVGGLFHLPLPALSLSEWLIGLAAILTVLSFVRVAIRRSIYEGLASITLLPLVLVALAGTLKVAHGLGYPVWAALFGAGFSLLYTVAAGRDFTFLGQFILTAIASSAALALYANQTGFTHTQSAWALGSNVLFLAYSVYDRSMVMYRRRAGDEFAAVVDLYRDVFNVFGYAWRCVQHWKRHQIWVVPR